MIQLNLLPDVKLEYLKAQRMRRLAIAISFIVTSAAVAILVLILIFEGFQKHTLTNINNDISTQTNTLQKEPEIDGILTVQSQLQNLNTLHGQKPAVTRLFGYLNELTPTPVTISNLAVDFNAHTISISGSADALNTVDQYVDTLKFTDYSTGSNSPNLPAFNTVILSSFSLDNTTTPPATYTITANFAPAIFNIAQNVSLVIPNKVTTRSDLEQPGPLFVQPPKKGNALTGQSGEGQ
jgi:hypothetical protein